MTLKLEVGKKYRTRRGEVVGPLAQVSDGCFRSNLARWYPDGVFNRSVINGPYDLIEEVIEPQEPAKEPHKHCELIKAWADGISLQKRYPLATNVSKHRADWHDFEYDFYPNWEADWIEYRIKPEPKPDVVTTYTLTKRSFYKDESGCGNLMIIWDGETGELKDAEVLK